MTAEERNVRAARAGRLLVALGVAVWPAWGVWFLAGGAPHVAWAVLAHLVLVVPGGALLRRSRPRPVGAAARRKRIGEALIAFGVLAWAPYLYLTETGREVPSLPFLLWHLSGVVPGAILRYTAAGWPLRPRTRPGHGRAASSSRARVSRSSPSARARRSR